MRTWYSFFTIILIAFSFSELFAEGGYIGENPGINFYSTIDEWNYSITKKMVTVRLKEKPSLDLFAQGCIKAKLLKWWVTDVDTLENIRNGMYKDLITLLAKNGASSISTDDFQSLVECIKSRYEETLENTKKEQQAVETISSIGLYTDGDTTNSDYDILSDIWKINSIIFAIPLKYEWVKNSAGIWFTSFLAGNTVPSLFPPPSWSGTGNGSNTASWGTNLWVQSGATLASLIGGSCNIGTGVNIADMMDGNLTDELSNILGGGDTATNNVGFTLGSNNTQTTDNQLNTNNTSANDFFHTMPCNSIFCIDTKLTGGNQNLLSGGKNISIEGILEKNSAILDKIKDTSLQYQKMTNNEWWLPYPNLKLSTVVGWARVYLANSAQISRRDKKDETPERKKEELASMIRCGLASSGLPTDPVQANGVGGAWYVLSNGLTSENIANKSKTLWAQATDAVNYIWCLQKNMDVGRKSYYDSFSTDLTEIQAFTSSMLSEINAVLDIGIQLNNKPIK